MSSAALDTMAALAEAGISMKDVTDKLLADGVQLFSDAFEKLLAAVDTQTQAVGSRKNQPPDLLPARAACRRGTSRR